MSRILSHVQYLKGIGHLQRAGLIAAAAAARGLDVHIASGGLPVPGFAPEGATLHQLPPLQAGPGGFTDLRDERGETIGDAWRAARREQLLALFETLAPDLLLVESFPFGRRALAFELLPLLERARARTPRPAVVCSIRDILQTSSKPGRGEETVSRIDSWFDAVMVHGDPAFAALEETFPAAANIAGKLHYTGFAGARDSAFEPNDDTPRGEVVVSMGGGAVGPALMEAALDARARTTLAERPWRLITGPNLPESDFARLRGMAGDGASVERFRDDFRALLAAAKFSISYAGYNTTLDLMRARVPAVIVTYSGSGGGETEQTMRATRLEALGLAVALPDSALSADSLAAAIARALALPAAPRSPFAMDGAARSAALLAKWAGKTKTVRG